MQVVQKIRSRKPGDSHQHRFALERKRPGASQTRRVQAGQSYHVTTVSHALPHPKPREWLLAHER